MATIQRAPLGEITNAAIMPAGHIAATGGKQLVKAAPRASEPLLDENADRFCMFPISHPRVWEMYKKAMASFWTGGDAASARCPLCRAGHRAQPCRVGRRAT